MPEWSLRLCRAVLWTALLLLAAAGGFLFAQSQRSLPQELAFAMRQLWERIEEELSALWAWGATPASQLDTAVFMASRFIKGGIR